jgi:hypothetical protein
MTLVLTSTTSTNKPPKIRSPKYENLDYISGMNDSVGLARFLYARAPTIDLLQNITAERRILNGSRTGTGPKPKSCAKDAEMECASVIDQGWKYPAIQG